MRSSVMASVGCAALALAGCSSGLENIHTGSFFVQPGKYQFLKCPDLAQRSLAGSNRARETVSRRLATSLASSVPGTSS